MPQWLNVSHRAAVRTGTANVPLVTSDRGLLNARLQARFPILKPSEFPLGR
jgi:hypothetical protein